MDRIKTYLSCIVSLFYLMCDMFYCIVLGYLLIIRVHFPDFFFAKHQYKEMITLSIKKL